MTLAVVLGLVALTIWSACKVDATNQRKRAERATLIAAARRHAGEQE